MAKATYRPAPEVQELAEGLIEQYHRHLIDFGVKIRYEFVDKTPKSKGEDVWVQVKKVSGYNAYLEGFEDNPHDSLFAIIVPEDVWEMLTPEHRIPLIDHALCSCFAEAKQQKEEAESDADLETDNPVKLSVVPCDVVEHSAVLRRHGLWRDKAEAYVEAKKKEEETDET